MTRAVTRDARIVLDARNDVLGPTEIVKYQVQSGLLLPAGRYQLRASATSGKTKAGGSVYLEIEVPDFKSGVALGSLVIGLGSDPLVPVAANAMTKGWLPIDPVLSREFSAMSALRVIRDVTRSTRNAVDARIELFTVPPSWSRRFTNRRLPLGQPARLDATVPLRGLTAGAYVLRVAASDGVTTAQREVGFSVR